MPYIVVAQIKDFVDQFTAFFGLPGNRIDVCKVATMGATSFATNGMWWMFLVTAFATVRRRRWMNVVMIHAIHRTVAWTTVASFAIVGQKFHALGMVPLFVLWKTRMKPRKHGKIFCYFFDVCMWLCRWCRWCRL